MYGRRNKLEFCTDKICLTEKYPFCEHALPGCSAVLNQMEPSQCVPLRAAAAWTRGLLQGCFLSENKALETLGSTQICRSGFTAFSNSLYCVREPLQKKPSKIFLF